MGRIIEMHPTIQKVYHIPPIGSTIQGEPGYQPFSYMLRIKLNGRLVNAKNFGIAPQRYNIPEGWVEGRPASPVTGKIAYRAPHIRRHGVVTVEMGD